MSVTIIGDSITEMSAAALRRALPGARVLAQSSRHTKMQGGPTTGGSGGLSVLRANRHKLGDTVVMALGSNDEGVSPAAFRKWVDEAVRIAGPNRKIVWVNTTNNQGANRALQQAQRAHPNLTIADWKSHAVVGGDGLHPTTAGTRVFARTVASAVGATGSTPTKATPAAAPSVAGSTVSAVNGALSGDKRQQIVADLMSRQSSAGQIKVTHGPSSFVSKVARAKYL